MLGGEIQPVNGLITTPDIQGCNKTVDGFNSRSSYVDGFFHFVHLCVEIAPSKVSLQHSKAAMKPLMVSILPM